DGIRDRNVTGVQTCALPISGIDGVVSDGSRIEDVNVRGGGLLAVALDPQFAVNHFAYIVYTARPRGDSAVIRLARVREAAGTFADRDRKSTRLNSSHVSISYAVFCLQKKK